MGMGLVWVVDTAGVTFSKVSIYLWTERLERLDTVGARGTVGQRQGKGWYLREVREVW